MAGAGYRTWTAGEVVTATNVQTYLQDQTVGVYANAAARSSAILSPTQGQVSYRKDDDIVEAYDGTNWVPVSAPDTSGLIHIETQSVTAASAIIFNDVFSSLYDNYLIVTKGITSANSNMFIRLRASGSDDTGNNYTRQRLLIDGTSATPSRTGPASTAWRLLGTDSTRISGAESTIFNPFLASSTGYKSYSFDQTSNAKLDLYGGTHSQNTSYDGFTCLMDSGTMTLDVSVYGYRKA